MPHSPRLVMNKPDDRPAPFPRAPAAPARQLANRLAGRLARPRPVAAVAVPERHAPLGLWAGRAADRLALRRHRPDGARLCRTDSRDMADLHRRGDDTPSPGRGGTLFLRQYRLAGALRRAARHEHQPLAVRLHRKGRGGTVARAGRHVPDPRAGGQGAGWKRWRHRAAVPEQPDDRHAAGFGIDAICHAPRENDRAGGRRGLQRPRRAGAHPVSWWIVGSSRKLGLSSIFIDCHPGLLGAATCDFRLDRRAGFPPLACREIAAGRLSGAAALDGALVAAGVDGRHAICGTGGGAEPARARHQPRRHRPARPHHLAVHPRAALSGRSG